MIRILFRAYFLLYFILISVLGPIFAKFVIVNTSLPLLPTELFILVWLLYKISQALKGERFLVYPFSATLVFGIFALGVLGFIRKPDAYALRYSTMVFYVVLAFITCDFLESRKDFKKIIQAAKLAILLSLILTLTHLPTSLSSLSAGSVTTTPGVYYIGVGNFGIYFLIFSWALSEFLSRRRISVEPLIWIILCLCWVLLFYFHRSAVLALIAAFASFILTKPVHFLRGLPKMVVLAVLASMIFVLSSGYFSKTGLVSAPAIYHRLYSILTPGEDYNASWRLSYWQHLIRSTFDNPGDTLWGKGFSLTPSEIDESKEGSLLTAPVIGFHNSFLAVLYKTGLLGLFLIVLFFGRALSIGFREKDPFIGIAGLSLIAMMVFAFFNVVLENPYYGFFMWFYSGAIYKLNQIKNRNQVPMGPQREVNLALKP